MPYHYTPARLAQITRTRDRLNRAGDSFGLYTDWAGELALDTAPRNGSAWNRKRIAVRNRCNAILRAAERAAAI